MKKDTAMRRWLWTVVFLGVVSTSPVFGELQLEVAPANASTQTLVTVTVSDEFPSTCFSPCDVEGYWVGPTEYHIDWYIREYTSPYCSAVVSRRSSDVDLGLLEPGDYLVTASEYVTLLDEPCELAILTAETDTTFHVTEAPPIPCPIEGAGNCQMCSAEDTQVLLSDLTVPPAGAVHADDFVPETTLIDTLCVWGTYLDGRDGQFNHSCSGKVEDNFRVRIYDDANGLPGDLIAERWVEYPVKSYVPDCPGWNGKYEENFPLEVFTLSFPTITLPAAGVTYWLEVANETNPILIWDGTCYWHWMQVVQGTTEGNRVAAVGTDDRCLGGEYDDNSCDLACIGGHCDRYDDICSGGPRNDEPCCPDSVCKPGYGGGYIDGSERWSGTMFCLGNMGAAVNFTPGSVATGACCDCEDICVDDLTQAECADLSPGFDRRWRRGETCASSTACDPEPGDNCDVPGAGTAAGTGVDSIASEPQELDCIPITDGLYAIDTTCTNTDGHCCPTGQSDNQMGKDVWYCYTTPRTGTIIASMCASSISWGGYDSYIALYHNFDHPSECLCPGDTLQYQLGESDEGCNGIPDGGAGAYGPQIVFPGECWLIRVGGWGPTPEETDSGPGFLDVATRCGGCECHTPMDPPEPERLNIPPDYPVSTKNRFLSFAEMNSWWSTAIRVTAVELPSSHDIWEGQQWYVGPPIQVCENSGQGLEIDPQDPPPGGCADDDDDEQTPNWFWAAPLLCDWRSAHYMDWTTLSDYCNAPGTAYNAQPCWSPQDCGPGTCGVDGVIHVYHEAIVPSHMATSTGPIDDPAVYDIQVIDDRASLFSESCYSDPLTMTQAGWGDVVTDVTHCPNGPPDNSVGVVTDVVALLNKFTNIGCHLQKTRAQLFGHEVGFKINITDVVQCIGAFVGGEYPFKPGECVDGVCSGGPDHGILCETDDDCSSDPCGLDP